MDSACLNLLLKKFILCEYLPWPTQLEIYD